MYSLLSLLSFSVYVFSCHNCCQLKRFSFERRKVIVIVLSTLHDWLKKFAPLFHPIRSTTKANLETFACIFPRFASATCNYFELWLVHCIVCALYDWLEWLRWFYDTQLKTALFARFSISRLHFLWLIQADGTFTSMKMNPKLRPRTRLRNATMMWSLSINKTSIWLITTQCSILSCFLLLYTLWWHWQTGTVLHMPQT